MLAHVSGLPAGWIDATVTWHGCKDSFDLLDQTNS